MSSVTVSPKFHVVIPKKVRERMKIRPGQKLEVFDLDGRIELVRPLPMRELRGFLKGIDTEVPREEDRA